MGELGKSLEFLMLKVAQLETLAELQQVELDAQRSMIEKCMTKLGLSDSEVGLAQKPKGSEESVREAHAVLKRVIQKHAHQREKKEYHPDSHKQQAAEEKEPELKEKDELKEAHKKEALGPGGSGEKRALLQKREKEKKGSKWGGLVKAAKSGWDATGGQVTDGSLLTGEALTNAYKAAKDAGNAVEFVKNTAINTVEMAVAILTGGGAGGYGALLGQLEGRGFEVSGCLGLGDTRHAAGLVASPEHS